MDAPQKTETAPPTPEQLLQLLELQMERERSKRANKSRNRATFLVTGLLVIVAAVGIAVLVAQQMLVEVREHARPAPTIGALDDGR